MPSESLIPARAGFWRRVGALIVDLLIFGVALALLGTAAFRLTEGRVQIGPVGLSSVSCIARQDISPNLTPPPPENSNYALECTSGALPGLAMTRTLIVGRRTASLGPVMQTWASYPMSTDGSIAGVHNARWIGQVGVLAFLAAFLCRKGSTPGMRLLRIRMINIRDANALGIPLSKLALRTAVIAAGFLPAFVLAIVALSGAQKHPEQAPTIALLLSTLLLATAWTLWNAILTGRKRDPVYDRVSRLAVVKSQAV